MTSSGIGQSWVEVGDWVYPEFVRAIWHRDSLVVTVAGRVDPDRGPILTSYTVSDNDGLAWDQTKLPVVSLFRDATATVALEQVGPSLDLPDVPRPGRSVDPRAAWNRLDEVADAYRSALDRGDPVTRSVADRLGTTEGYAAQLIYRARRRGLLDPVTAP